MTVKRSEFLVYLDTTPAAAPTWGLVGDGITSAVVNYNPQTTEETYIHQDSGTTEIESYRPTMPIEAIAKDGDAVFEFVDSLRVARATLDAAKTTAILVNAYETPTAGAFPAESQEVSIQIDSFGGDGGQAARINYTINFLGDPTPGTFNPTTDTFTAT